MGTKGWFTSSETNGGCACVEVLEAPTGTNVRDSKWGRVGGPHPTPRPVISLSRSAWLAFVDEVAAAGPTCVTQDEILAVEEPDGGVTFRAVGEAATRSADAVLHFTPAEWAAFKAGVAKSEFGRPLEVV